jgi:hypothetical protein
MSAALVGRSAGSSASARVSRSLTATGTSGLTARADGSGSGWPRAIAFARLPASTGNVPVSK